MATIQDVFSHIYTTEAHLNDVAVKNGQIILCIDSGKLYIDHGTARVDTSGLEKVSTYDALPLAPLDKFYVTEDTSNLYLYIGGAWKQVNQSETNIITGDGLTGKGTDAEKLQLDLSRYETYDQVNLTFGGGINTIKVENELRINVSEGLMSAVLNEDGILLRANGMPIIIDSREMAIQIFSGVSDTYDTDILLNGHSRNTAGGFAIVDAATGKLPSSILPQTTTTIDNYTSNSTIKLTSTAGAVNLISNTGEAGLYSGSTSYVKVNGTVISLQATTLTLNGSAQNTANGVVVLNSDGKVPTALLPEISQSWTKQTISQSNFSTDDSTYGGKYMELTGICSVEVYDAGGYKVEFDVKCDFTNSKTRIYIPSGLTADTISNWTLLYLAKSIA